MFADEDLGWFFDQYIYGTAVVDYAVEDITVVPAENADIIVNQVHLARLSDGIFPQEIKVVFENGVVESVDWDGQEEEKMFTFERPVAIEEVHLDPDNDIWLDVNQFNNRLRKEPETKFARLKLMNFTVWLQQLFNVAGALF